MTMNTFVVTAVDIGGPAGQILLMLFIAFALGTTFGYLIREPRKHRVYLRPLELSAGSTSRDNLQRITGINKNTEILLNAEGIYTFHQLANTSPERLRAIMDIHGYNLKESDPSAWPSDAARLHTAI